MVRMGVSKTSDVGPIPAVPAIILIGVYGVTEHCAWSISTLNLQKPLTVVLGRGSLIFIIIRGG